MRLPGSRALLVAFGVLALALGAARITLAARLPVADFAFVNSAEPSSLDPAAASGVPEGRVLRFLFEGLCVKDPRTLEPAPGVAERWDVSPDGTLYTFHLRADARWSNGDVVTAEDFRASFRRLLDPRTAAPYGALLWPVVGAREWSNRVDEHGESVRSFDDVAIRAIDARTLAIELERPLPYFLDLLASPPCLPVHVRSIEASTARGVRHWTHPENLVTNGPYTLALRRVNDRLRFARSATYWDARHVGFATVDCLAVEHPVTALNLYLTGEVGWIDNPPPAVIPELAGRDDFRARPFLATYFYRINVTRPPLDDRRVRRALALTIDRSAITEQVMRAGERPAFGLVPPGARDHDGVELAHARDADGFAIDVAEARALLVDAGYGTGGRALPTVEIHYNNQGSHKDVAEIVADGWRKHLGIATRLLNQEWKVALDTQRTLGYQVSRSSWVADHLDPIGFLEVFTSTSENNRTGFADARYDALIERATRARGSERRELLADAERRLLEELPILPVYFYVTRNLVDPRLDGFFDNALDEHPPKSWRWRAGARGD
ncbi:MAG: peptide ABC transporter substrate-binding protein [Planctomycetota bacterium]